MSAETESLTGYCFVELGEGYDGDYDPANPNDVELLRLDYCVNGEEVESLCTNLPVSLTAEQRNQCLALIAQFATWHPELRPTTIVELFSHMDPSWLTAGIPAAVTALFGIKP
ncbi:MAG TPA: hypothetical protein VHD87_15195 [Acidimicrobiales bacterium]|nr:hypothetical protein [Acidimicrobiales bacterium]